MDESPEILRARRAEKVDQITDKISELIPGVTGDHQMDEGEYCFRCRKYPWDSNGELEKKCIRKIMSDDILLAVKALGHNSALLGSGHITVWSMEITEFETEWRIGHDLTVQSAKTIEDIHSLVITSK